MYIINNKVDIPECGYNEIQMISYICMWILLLELDPNLSTLQIPSCDD